MITFDCAVHRLAELGNKKRLAIFRYLLQFGRCGVPVGQIQKELDIPGSTLSHHLSRMIQAGLVKQNRCKSTLYCVAQGRVFIS
ncbi:ArsR/SmtB family transcription factor [Dongshaea marina]|uniref:ArsR/SmtB family transcription factor n=1 Tax=Dongshaea marina TaxID=2047966 RepID=UPI001F2BDD2E|nr:winged helix-turn-helix domain-containing protein [Dongshaea marina]